mmetsp:Transcript_16509/g.39011  ORF Transcript_16509/g.39011 Transcript_16509/m.39011 type:complete len:246 (+) Transcript_16509:324-1061(+)
MDTSFRFGDKLFCSTTKNHGGSQSSRTICKDVETLISHLSFFKHATSPQHGFWEALGSASLNRGTSGFGHSFQVLFLHTTGAKQSTIGKVLSGQISNGEFGQDNAGTRLYASIQFVKDDLPLGVDNGLVFSWIANSNFRVLLFGFEFQFHVQQQDFGVFKLFGHGFKSGVRERFGKSNTAQHQERLSNISAWNLFDGNPGTHVIQSSQFVCFFVAVVVFFVIVIERPNGFHHHGRKQILVIGNQL